MVSFFGSLFFFILLAIAVFVSVYSCWGDLGWFLRLGYLIRVNYCNGLTFVYILFKEIKSFFLFFYCNVFFYYCNSFFPFLLKKSF